MNIIELLEDINDKVEEAIGEMTQIRPEACGLDNRAGYRLWISEDGIAVQKRNDGTLQYYGGFEYVDKEYRTEIGDYVLYHCDDERVQGHIDRWEETSFLNDTAEQD